MNFREFKNKDAEFCFKTRASAFIEKFNEELNPKIISLCVNEYVPNDYIRLSHTMKIFIVEDSKEKVGFFTIKRIDKDTAEIPLIYFKTDKLGKGYGKRSMEYVEEWVKLNWEGVKRIFLDTIIPNFNGGFYRKMNYTEVRENFCIFSGQKVKSKLFEKYLD